MQFLGFFLIIITSVFFTGILIKTKSILSGRKGPPVLQSIWDIRRLLQKGSVYSETTGFIFKIAPAVYFASVIMSILVIPFGKQTGIISFSGDFVFFAYILAAGKFFNIIGALDTGSSLEGMGASREVLYSLLAEPAFFVLIGSFALLTGHFSFTEIFTSFHLNSYISYSVAILASFVLILIAMIENSRMPVNDPKTHLELTMVHEVMILDNSGFDLALIFYASNLKFAIYGSIIANLFISKLNNLIYSILLFLGIQILLAIMMGIMESFIARFRMNHNSQYIFTLTSVSLLIFIMILIGIGKMD